ncbi:MAG: hypothetical protein OXG56_04430 [Gammaproteobacteria bacterium]|nr:hypothetical protein [Gammaproteobacteria bacterium]
MSKYEPLADHLRESSQPALSMTFDEIEEVVGAKLPPSAFKHRAWWSNNPANSVITDAWLGAGYETAKVDMQNRKLEFRKVLAGKSRGIYGIFGDPAELSTRADGGQQSQKEPRLSGSDTSTDFYLSIFGALKGTVTIKAGTNLTSPVGEEWDSTR